MSYCARGCYGADVKVIQKENRLHGKKCLYGTKSPAITGHNTSFLTQGDHETEILGRWENAACSWAICYSVFSALTSSLGIASGLCQRYWTRRPISGLIIVIYLRKHHFYLSTLGSGEDFFYETKEKNVSTEKGLDHFATVSDSKERGDKSDV